MRRAVSVHLAVLSVFGFPLIAIAQTTWYVDDNNCPGPGSGTQTDPFCEIQDGIYVISWAGKENFDKSRFNEEKASFGRNVETSNQQMLFSKWIQNVREKSEIQDLRPARMR